MKKLITVLMLAIAVKAMAVQPPVGGVFEMAWTKALTNPIVDWCIWESVDGGVKWKQIGETRTNWFKWTNLNINPNLTRYAVTEMSWSPSGSQDKRVMTDMRLLHWAPSNGEATNANNYVVLRTGMFKPPFYIRVSSDLSKFDDWFYGKVFSNGEELTNATVWLQHSTSPEKQKFYFNYQQPQVMPPMPSASARTSK